MTFVVGPSRKGSLVSRVFAAIARDAKAEKKAAKKGGKPEVSIPKDNPVRSEAYRRLVASMPCRHCHVQGHGQAAHPPPIGKSIKQDDRGCFSLCTTRASKNGAIEGCHSLFDQYKLMPHEAAVKQAAQWGAETRAEIIEADAWPKRLPRMVEAKPASRKMAAA